jgi:tRNA(fMet)-specific endonuclease VapC
MIVADTDVLIDFLAGVDPVAARIAHELESGDLVTTAVTRFELMAGAKETRQRRAVQDLLSGLPTLPLDADAADAAARVRRDLEGKGAAIGMADSLIAGITLVNDAILLTRNRRHFERVPRLHIGNL